MRRIAPVIFFIFIILEIPVFAQDLPPCISNIMKLGSPGWNGVL